MSLGYVNDTTSEQIQAVQDIVSRPLTAQTRSNRFDRIAQKSESICNGFFRFLPVSLLRSNFFAGSRSLKQLFNFLLISLQLQNKLQVSRKQTKSFPCQFTIEDYIFSVCLFC